MSNIKFSNEHEYIKIDGDIGTIGISNYAQEQLGDIVFVELPEIDKEVNKGDEVAVIESVKAASELYSPASGKIIEINEQLDLDPALVNSSAQENGWIYKIKITKQEELDELMNEEAYASFIA